ncbi:MAG: glycosyltransferase, partial [Gemmataceae bacterium]|nr:glycosyltransferase [Gemmataceae bacterium]
MPLRFSVVVPARNRPHTLTHTLRTCLAQDFDDYQVVVSDNSQGSAIGEVAARADSPRVKYVRTPRALAMTDSWEFAVSQADGEFVTVLGEDDGLAPYSLPAIDALLRQSGAELLRWESALYGWPDTADQRH